MQRECDEAGEAHEVAKAGAAAFKKTWEAKKRKLNEYIRALTKPVPLFEQWRAHPVTELGLPDFVATLLQEAGLDTVGQIADWTSAGKLLTDIPNVGEKKAEAIEQALERFWGDRKDGGQDARE